LLQAVDEEGTPLYQPYPAPVRYPLLSVYRKGFKYRSYQNFSIHKFRHINWPTISDDVGRCDLGNVTTSKMPMAWDYKFQLDFFCNRPDTQAFFVEKLMREFYKTGGTPQTWIAVEYPAWGRQLIRVYIDGDIENNTPEEPEADKNVEFRTTVNIVVEGFSLDLDFKIEPAFWTLIFGTGSIDPVTLQRAFEPLREDDVRIRDNNVTMLARSNLPEGYRVPGGTESAWAAVYEARLHWRSCAPVSAAAGRIAVLAVADWVPWWHSIVGGLRRGDGQPGHCARYSRRGRFRHRERGPRAWLPSWVTGARALDRGHN
jgi:hypothetical protein